MTFPQEPTRSSERTYWSFILRKVREAMEKALDHEGVSPSSVSWTEMRWDVPDVTATWTTDEMNRNMHAWLSGGWPSYRADFEGAVWQDDEDKGERRARFIPGPFAYVRVGGPADSPSVRIDQWDQLMSALRGLVIEIQEATLNTGAARYDLWPDPRSQADLGG